MNRTQVDPSGTPAQRVTYTAAETARMLGIAVKSVHNYVRAGKLQAARMPGRWLITKASVDALLASAASPPTPGAQRQAAE